jgi:hypothetical protein
MIVQALLASLFFLAFVLYLSSFRSTGRDRILASVMFVLALAAVSMPELTMRIANMLGIGRGADLIMYVSVSCGTVLAVLLYAKIASVDAKLTKLVRHTAISEALAPPATPLAGASRPEEKHR